MSAEDQIHYLRNYSKETKRENTEKPSETVIQHITRYNKHIIRKIS